MTNRPNILFFMSDEHRADVTGFAGNRVVRTPILDDLARTGIVFSNAYTPSPICVPARQCLMTGQLPRTCGCEVYGDDLAPGAMTFARRFAEYAYQTVACGKLHHMGADQMQGWTKRIGLDDGIDARYLEGRVTEEFARYLPPMKLKWSQAKEVQRAGVGRATHVVRDTYTVEGSLHYLIEHFLDPFYDRATPDTPLLLKVSLNQPHYPYLTESQERFEYYLNRVEPYVNPDVFDHPFLGGKHRVRAGVEVTERELRRATAAYYAMVETVDTHFGRVLETLRHAGQDPDDWIIVYTSDHGEMLGQHGVFEKQKFFEASVRVPLIIRWPNHFPSRVVSENVNLCDLFATLCDLAGIPIPPDLDSRSLVPLMGGDTSSWNNETISQFGGTNLMIKRDQLKYQYYGPDRPEVLFDLTRNLEETVNLIEQPEYTAQLAAFRKRAAELGFGPEATA